MKNNEQTFVLLEMIEIIEKGRKEVSQLLDLQEKTIVLTRKKRRGVFKVGETPSVSKIGTVP